MRNIRHDRAALLRTIIVVFASLLLTLGTLATPARANMISLSGTFSGVATLTPTSMPGIFTEDFTGTGTDVTFGNFTISTSATLAFSPPTISVSGGNIDLAFTNGALGGTSSGSGSVTGSGSATFTAEFLVNDSSGIFEGLGGEVTETGTLTRTSPFSASVSGAYSGTLATPEPSPLVLLSPLLIVLWLARSRHLQQNL